MEEEEDEEEKESEEGRGGEEEECGVMKIQVDEEQCKRRERCVRCLKGV